MSIKAFALAYVTENRITSECRCLVVSKLDVGDNNYVEIPVE